IRYRSVTSQKIEQAPAQLPKRPETSPCPELQLTRTTSRSMDLIITMIGRPVSDSRLQPRLLKNFRSFEISLPPNTVAPPEGGLIYVLAVDRMNFTVGLSISSATNPLMRIPGKTNRSACLGCHCRNTIQDLRSAARSCFRKFTTAPIVLSFSPLMNTTHCLIRR